MQFSALLVAGLAAVSAAQTVTYKTTATSTLKINSTATFITTTYASSRGTALTTGAAATNGTFTSRTPSATTTGPAKFSNVAVAAYAPVGLAGVAVVFAAMM